MIPTVNILRNVTNYLCFLSKIFTKLMKNKLNTIVDYQGSHNMQNHCSRHQTSTPTLHARLNCGHTIYVLFFARIWCDHDNANAEIWCLERVQQTYITKKRFHLRNQKVNRRTSHWIKYNCFLIVGAALPLAIYVCGYR